MNISVNTHISQFEDDVNPIYGALIEGRPMHAQWLHQSLTWTAGSKLYRTTDELLAFHASLPEDGTMSQAQADYVKLMEQRIQEARDLAHWAIAHTGEAQIQEMIDTFRVEPTYDESTLKDYCELEGCTMEEAIAELEVEVNEELSTTQGITEAVFRDEIQKILTEVEKTYRSCVDATGHFVPNVPEEVKDFVISDFTYVGLLRKAADKAEQWSLSQNLQVKELTKRRILGKERKRLIRGADGRVIQDNPAVAAKANELLLQDLAKQLNLKAHELQKAIDARPTMVDMQQQREAEEDASFNEENGTVTSYGPGIDRQTLMAERMQQAEDELAATVVNKDQDES